MLRLYQRNLQGSHGISSVECQVTSSVGIRLFQEAALRSPWRTATETGRAQSLDATTPTLPSGVSATAARRLGLGVAVEEEGEEEGEAAEAATEAVLQRRLLELTKS